MNWKIVEVEELVKGTTGKKLLWEIEQDVKYDGKQLTDGYTVVKWAGAGREHIYRVHEKVTRKGTKFELYEVFERKERA